MKVIKYGIMNNTKYHDFGISKRGQARREGSRQDPFIVPLILVAWAYEIPGA